VTFSFLEYQLLKQQTLIVKTPNHKADFDSEVNLFELYLLVLFKKNPTKHPKPPSTKKPPTYKTPPC